MAEMKKLTVNGQTYTVRDPEAARIDDTAVSENTAWSSKKISDEIGKGGGGVGIDGATFYPSVSADGVIAWTNDGSKENPEPIDLVAAVISALPVYNGEVEAL